MLHHLLHSVYTVQECFGHEPSYSGTTPCNPQMQPLHKIQQFTDRIPSTNPGAEPPRDAKDSGSARSHSTHLETSSSALQIDLKWSPSVTSPESKLPSILHSKFSHPSGHLAALPTLILEWTACAASLAPFRLHSSGMLWS